MYLVRETGTYYKEYVVDGPPERVVSMVGSSTSIELAQGIVLTGKPTYTSTKIDEKSKLDFSVKQAIQKLTEPYEEEKVKAVKPKQKRDTLTTTKLAELLED